MVRGRYICLLILLILPCLETLAHAVLTVTLAWDYVDSGQDGFGMLRCTGAGGADCTPTATLALSIGPTIRQASDTTPTGGTHYCYAVVATLSGSADSGSSNVVCLTVPISLPQAPRSLRIGH